MSKETHGNMDEIKVNKFVKVSALPSSSSTDLSSIKQPLARSGHRAVADNNNIWIIGGFNPNTIVNSNRFFPLFRELWKYNVYTKHWTHVDCTGNMPSELASHSAVIQSHYLIIFGGTGYPFGENSSNKVSICDLETGCWRVAECSGSIPDKIYGQAMTVWKNDLYIFGGTTGFLYNSDLYKLNLDSFVWEYIQPEDPWTSIPSERYRHEIACLNNKIILLGGGTSDSVCPMVNIPIYDIENNKWMYRTSLPDTTVKPGFPKARRCHSCVQLDDMAYICGGYDENEIIGDLWKINLSTLKWTHITNMIKPVYFHSAAITDNGCMFIFGGISCIVPTERTDECYRIWLKIPKLQTLCWMSLIDHNPHLLKLPHSKLLKLGILKDFINTLPCPQGA